MIHSQTRQYFTFIYAGFLVFVTPLAIPFAILGAVRGEVDSKVWILTLVMYALSGLGITLGYHRLITHRAFETSWLMKRLLMICGSFAMQGPAASWASLHIQHHRYSDKPGDPHSPVVNGFWYSHCGWVFKGYNPDFRRFGKWLLKDNDVKHVSKYYIHYSVLGLIIPALIAGWQGFLWAGLVRLFVSSHVTWGINSICHLFGARDNDTHENSRNNFIMALLSFGEGWHNNHHRFMQSPYFGFKWYQIDFGKMVLIVLRWFGLIWDLKVPREPQPVTSN
jgi:stearoyl-CoA desaturase (delta-9 desaturase)